MMLASPWRKRQALAEVTRRRGIEETYTNPLGVEAVQAGDFSDLQQFMREFYKTFYNRERKRDREEVLEQYADVKAHYYALVVANDKVSEEEFWQRYEYRCDKDRILREWEQNPDRGRQDRADAIAVSFKALLDDSMTAVKNAMAGNTQITVSPEVLSNGTTTGLNKKIPATTMTLTSGEEKLDDSVAPVATKIRKKEKITGPSPAVTKERSEEKLETSASETKLSGEEKPSKTSSKDDNSQAGCNEKVENENITSRSLKAEGDSMPSTPSTAEKKTASYDSWLGGLFYTPPAEKDGDLTFKKKKKNTKSTNIHDTSKKNIFLEKSNPLPINSRSEGLRNTNKTVSQRGNESTQIETVTNHPKQQQHSSINNNSTVKGKPFNEKTTGQQNQNPVDSTNSSSSSPDSLGNLNSVVILIAVVVGFLANGIMKHILFANFLCSPSMRSKTDVFIPLCGNDTTSPVSLAVIDNAHSSGNWKGNNMNSESNGGFWKRNKNTLGSDNSIDSNGMENIIMGNAEASTNQLGFQGSDGLVGSVLSSWMENFNPLDYEQHGSLGTSNSNTATGVVAGNNNGLITGVRSTNNNERPSGVIGFFQNRFGRGRSMNDNGLTIPNVVVHQHVHHVVHHVVHEIQQR